MTNRYAVIGHPITHSRSPKIHEAAMIDLEIDATFEAIDVAPNELENWVKNEFRNEFQGAAVTTPHKEAIRKYVDAETEVVKKIGAINTLYKQEDKIIGTNTDFLGILHALQTHFTSLKELKCLVLGAGGAARSAIFALQQAGAKVAIWNRTESKSETLADEFGIGILPDFVQLNPIHFDIVINATPVGFQEWESVIPEDFWHPSHIAFDMVYDPLETKFLSDAGDAGATIITGDQMLIGQAMEQFRIWHGVEIEPEVMEGAFFE